MFWVVSKETFVEAFQNSFSCYADTYTIFPLQKVVFEKILFSRCELWSLPHLSIWKPNERKALKMQFKTLFDKIQRCDLHFHCKRYFFLWAATFDLSYTSTNEKTKIRIFWVVTNKNLCCGSWNQFFTVTRNVSKFFIVKNVFTNLLFSNCDFWCFPNLQ